MRRVSVRLKGKRLRSFLWKDKGGEDGFSVSLSFNQLPAKLDIPFSAITAFVDPAVDFGLQFQAMADDEHESMSGFAGNDSAERDIASRVTPSEDGSNVVSVDFGKKK